MIVEPLSIQTKSYPDLPLQDHVTLRDVDKGMATAADTAFTFDMHQPLADPCPNCGAFRLTVGDYVCFGICDICMDDFMGTYEGDKL